MRPLTDCIDYNLKILFIGFNPSILSSETGHHFANPSNRFWTILYQSGLTPRKYKPEEDRDLLKLGYGLTNIVARPTRAAADISKEEYPVGKKKLIEKIRHYAPAIACFVGKGVYHEFADKRNIAWGVQECSIVEGTIDFDAPSSSGLVRMKLPEVVGIYTKLAQLLTS